MTSYIKGYYSKSIYQNGTGYNIGIFRVSDTNDESLADYIGRTILLVIFMNLIILILIYFMEKK